MEKTLSAFLILIGLNMLLLAIQLYRGLTGKTGRLTGKDNWKKYND